MMEEISLDHDCYYYAQSMIIAILLHSLWLFSPTPLFSYLFPLVGIDRYCSGSLFDLHKAGCPWLMCLQGISSRYLCHVGEGELSSHLPSGQSGCSLGVPWLYCNWWWVWWGLPVWIGQCLVGLGSKVQGDSTGTDKCGDEAQVIASVDIRFTGANLISMEYWSQMCSWRHRSLITPLAAWNNATSVQKGLHSRSMTEQRLSCSSKALL